MNFEKTRDHNLLCKISEKAAHLWSGQPIQFKLSQEQNQSRSSADYPTPKNERKTQPNQVLNQTYSSSNPSTVEPGNFSGETKNSSK